MAGVLQHLRSSTLNKRPNPASMVDGQIAINYASGSPGAFFKDTNGNLVKVGPVHVGATAPNVSPASGGTAGNSLGEQWLDTSGGTYVFKIWDGAAWRSEAGEFVNSTGDTMTGSLTMGPSVNLIFEGSTDDGFETTLTVVDPTADRTITLPNVSGTVVTTGDSGTVTSTMIADGTIVNADVNASAAIAGTKISPDFGSQTIQTTGVFSHAVGSAGAPTITFTGDTNTGIYSPGADQLAISTGGSGRLFVGSTGNIGLGTSSPTAFVQSNGSVKINAENSYFTIDADTNDRLGFVKKAGATPIFAAGSATSFIFGHSSGTSISDPTNQTFSERLRITSAGLVGVGVSSPSVLLQSQQTSAGASVIGASVVNNSVTAGTGVILDLTPSTAGPGVRGAQIEAVNTDGLNEISLALKTSSGGNPPATRLHITPAGRVGIGTTNPTSRLYVNGSSAVSNLIVNAGTTALSVYNDEVSGEVRLGAIDTSATNAKFLSFYTNPSGSSTGTERARIDSSGRLLVGTSSARGNVFADATTAATPSHQIETAVNTSWSTGLSIINNSGAGFAPVLTLGLSCTTSIGSNTLVPDGNSLGRINFSGNDGTNFVCGARIEGRTTGTTGSGDLPSSLVFSTTADGASSPTERMRIKAGGEVVINAAALGIDSTSKFYVSGTSEFIAPSGKWVQYIATAGTGNQNLVQFSRSNGSVEVGKITTDGTSTTYGTTSDYRLKQNITPVTESIARLKQLKPCQFSFTSNPDKIVDGFIAHEVQLVVPEAVTGTKDEVDVDNNPIYQAIDQSKLVPLLTAALQEAVAKIESLEARLTAASI